MELTHKTANELLHLFLDMGEMLLNSGAEVNRVEDTLSRMGNAYGASRMDVFVITSSIVVTMIFPDGMELTQTRRILDSGGTNFTRMERLNELSRRCSLEPMSIEVLRGELQQLKKKNIKGSILYLGSVLAAGSFAVFFGGTVWDGLAAAGFAFLICYLQKILTPLCPNKMIFNLISSLLIGMGICLTAKLVPALHIDKIMIGDIMLLIPGIAMTNSVRDILVGDTISGIMRLIESLLWAGALACGFMGAIWLIGG